MWWFWCKNAWLNFLHPYHDPSLLNNAGFGGITGSSVNLQLHQRQRLSLSLSNPLSLFSTEETRSNNYALCLIALATPVRQTKWLPRQWGDALLTASLRRIVNSADSLSSLSFGLIFQSLRPNSRMPPLWTVIDLQCLVSKTGSSIKNETCLTL